jgi:hypothetical protein
LGVVAGFGADGSEVAVTGAGAGALYVTGAGVAPAEAGAGAPPALAAPMAIPGGSGQLAPRDALRIWSSNAYSSGGGRR